jgi:putative tricarboxylic transport membrane protein
MQHNLSLWDVLSILDMKRFHILLIIFWMGLGLFAMVHAYSLGLKGFAGPGPGLMPFLVGLLLLLASLYLLVSSLLERSDGDKTRKGGQNRVNLGKTSLAVASLIAYALFVESLGFLITTTLLLITLLKGMGSKKWRSVVTASVLTSLITYFVFTYLRIRLPMGILRF